VVDTAGNTISFAFKTGGSSTGLSISIGEGIRLNQSDKVSGLSFLVDNGGTLNFRLYADGQLIDPENIYIGRANRHPSSSSALTIRSHNK
jgi:hypothetical protein